jgi:hypothetical protein
MTIVGPGKFLSSTHPPDAFSMSMTASFFGPGRHPIGPNSLIPFASECEA